MDGLGEIIRYLRKERGITQLELSEGVCSKDYIYAIESGKCEPSYYILEGLSRKLKVDIVDYYKVVKSHYSFEIHKTVLEIIRLILCGDYNQLMELLKANESEESFNRGEPQRIYNLAKAICLLDIDNNYLSALELCSVSLSLEEINLTEKYLNNRIFSLSEYVLVSIMGQCLLNKGEFNNAILLYSSIINKISYLLESHSYEFINKREIYLSLILDAVFNMAYIGIINKQFMFTHLLINGEIAIKYQHNNTTIIVAFLILESICYFNMDNLQSSFKCIVIITIIMNLL